MLTKIVTIGQLQNLQNNTYVYAAIIVVIALAISFIVAKMVPYQSGNDRSYIWRRIWFIIIGVVAAGSFYLYNDLAVRSEIVNAGFSNMFIKSNLISLGIILGGYVILGIVLMIVFRHSKYGSILGKGKE